MARPKKSSKKVEAVAKPNHRQRNAARRAELLNDSAKNKKS